MCELTRHGVAGERHWRGMGATWAWDGRGMGAAWTLSRLSMGMEKKEFLLMQAHRQ
jgi:hypothetical protein